jgi:GR25 family glycosyltransferase involved in LPS biosynthesis
MIANKLYLNDIFDKIYCINLKSRIDKRKKMEEQAKKYDLDIIFFDAISKPENPIRGCLESHLEIIKLAKQENLNNVLILEDDCVFLKGGKLNDIPNNWDMLYLGGNLDIILNSTNKFWIKGCIWTTHSYAITKNLYNKVITELENYSQEIDRYYKEQIHQYNNCYLIKDFLTTQDIGYSDIEKKKVDYAIDKIYDKEKIKFPEHQIIDSVVEYENNVEKNSSYRLKLFYPEKDLPKISIVTPTRNRKNLFKIWLDNYHRIDYPSNKMEFVIVDDGIENLRDILPIDDRIKYIRISTKNNIALPMGMKRNLCVKYSSYNIIVHMDDDDYYPSFSIKTRVKILMQNQDIECVGCTLIGCYNILTNKNFIVGHEGLTTLAEATMAYTREFYIKRIFNENILTGESKLFLRGRLNKTLQIPYMFIIIALTHGSNITSNLRTIPNNLYTQNIYWEGFPINFKNILLKISGNNKVGDNN